MKYAVIYNTSTGALICTSTLADDDAPTNGLVVNVPDGKVLKSINVSNQAPVYEDEPEDPTTTLELALVELDARISALES